MVAKSNYPEFSTLNVSRRCPSTRNKSLEVLNAVELAERWLAAQDTNGLPLSSNLPAVEVPFQRWFKFKEAFSPQFIIECASSLPRPPRSCLDPFGGSGTTALTAQFIGIRPTTIEVNPFLGDLIEAKLSKYDTDQLKRDYFNVLARSKRVAGSTHNLESGPPTLIEPGVHDRWLFARDVAGRIISLRDAVEKVRCTRNRRLLRIVLGSTLLGLSNAIVNGKGRKYRRDWKRRQKTEADVELAFREAFFHVFSDICQFGTRRTHEFQLIRGDSRVKIHSVDKVDFAVLSPPYPNSFDYTDIYNIELWMLGYLRTRPQNHKLRNATLRSHVQIKREFTSDTLGSKTLKRTYAKLSAARNSLWNAHIPEMICSYFADMSLILAGLKAKLSKRGRAFLAIGNSKYAGITVDTEVILKELALQTGFQTVSCRPIRSMRSSAQQGGRTELTESLITVY